MEASDGVEVHHVHAGPFEGLAKGDLPGQLCTFAREVLRAEASNPPGYFDAVHSHYWLSGQVGALSRDRWGVPLVHSMHTMAKVKNEALAEGDCPEPEARVIGEEQVVEAADMLIANTDLEAKQLINMYDAEPGRVAVVHPGVDLGVFRPAGRAAARAARGIPAARWCSSSPVGSSRSRLPTYSCGRPRRCCARPELRRPRGPDRRRSLRLRPGAADRAGRSRR